MKTFIIQATKFIVIGIFVYLFLTLIIPPTMVNNFHNTAWSEKFLMQDAKSLDSLDVLILGSSHVFNTFDPRVFKNKGYQLLNIASPSQTPENSYFILKDFFNGALSQKDKRPIPKVVVHELYCRTVSNKSAFESYVRSVEYHPSTYNFFKLGLLTGKATSINMFFSAMLKRKFGIYEDKKTYSDVPNYVKYGYYEKKSDPGRDHPRYDLSIEQIDTVFKDEQAKIQYRIKKVNNSKMCNSAPSKRQLSYLKKIIDLSNSYGVPVVLVVTPIRSDFSNNLENYREILDSLASFASDNNVLFIEDFSLARINENTDFADRDHLNVLGAAKVSNLFVKELERVGLLK